MAREARLEFDVFRLGVIPEVHVFGVNSTPVGKQRLCLFLRQDWSRPALVGLAPGKCEVLSMH